MVLLTALIATGMALTHLFSGKLLFLSGIPRSPWLSAAGGISVAYVFLHLLPELGERQGTIEEAGGLGLAFLEHHVYVMALVGLGLFYGLERAACVTYARVAWVDHQTIRVSSGRLCSLRGVEPLSKRRLSFLWGRLNSSFWFVPAIVVLAAIVLFFVTEYIDRSFVSGVAGVPVIASGGADAARSVLGAVSGGIVTVTATSFSLAIVTLQLASSGYTPRVMQNFLADRGVQMVLGVFLGTFTYSLLVLRIIRTPSGPTDAFVPVISLTVAVLLALICVGLLIYFIHHIADMIQSSSIVETAHFDSLRYIEGLGELEDPRGEAEESTAPGGEPLVLLCQRSGYIQHLELGSVAEAVGRMPSAGGGTTFVDIPSGPGFFVSAGLPVLRIWPPEGSEAVEVGREVEEKVHEAIITGKERSFQQDFAFGLRQLADIAILGLSPGVNDPTTSMQAMDRIEAILIALGEKSLPGGLQEYEIEGSKVVLRVGYYGFDDVVGLGLDQIRRSAFTSGQVAVLDRFLELTDRAIQANEPPDRRYSLWERALAVGRLAPQEITDPRDARNLALNAVKVGAPCWRPRCARRCTRTCRISSASARGCPEMSVSGRR